VRGDALRGAAEPPTHVFSTTGDPAAFHDLAERVLGLEIPRVEPAVIREGAA
jgi:hypothetical protein